MGVGAGNGPLTGYALQLRRGALAVGTHAPERRSAVNKLWLLWILLGPEELVALAAFLATVGVWAMTIGALLGR